MTVYEPRISAISIIPNPVNINKAFLVAVSVTEVEVVMYRVSKVSGAAISGEGVNPAVKFEEVS